MHVWKTWHAIFSTLMKTFWGERRRKWFPRTLNLTWHAWEASKIMAETFSISQIILSWLDRLLLIGWLLFWKSFFGMISLLFFNGCANLVLTFSPAGNSTAIVQPMSTVPISHFIQAVSIQRGFTPIHQTNPSFEHFLLKSISDFYGIFDYHKTRNMESK